MLSSFCVGSNLHIYVFKLLPSTCETSKEHICKSLIRTRFHVTIRIVADAIMDHTILCKTTYTFRTQGVRLFRQRSNLIDSMWCMIPSFSSLDILCLIAQDLFGWDRRATRGGHLGHFPPEIFKTTHRNFYICRNF